MSSLFKSVVLFFVLLLSHVMYAGTTGKLSGRVTDKSNGEALIGVNVLIDGTMLGATTDLDGYYFILNIPPGDYTIEAQYIGYRTVKVTGVEINVDLTTRHDFQMQEAVLEMQEEIVITAERELVVKDLTATTATIDGKEIQALPVTEISEVLDLQAGYVDGHVRGGRSGELAYWVDGVPVTDVYDGKPSIDVSKNTVEEMQFISGAFNAEYGQAMSGIVNITTKEPRESFGGSFTAYVGDNLSFGNDVYWNVGSFNPSHIYNVEAGINGVIIPDKLSYYINGRYIHFNGWLYGKRTYNPQNISFFDSTNAFVEFRDPEGVGDGSYVPMNWNDHIFFQGKLIYNISPVMKVFYSLIVDKMDYQDYDRNYKLDPDGNLNRFRTGYTNLLKFTHTLSNATYYDLGLSYFSKDYRQYVYKDKYDPRYIHPKINDSQQLYTFKTGGTNNQYFTRKTQTALAKFDMTSQLGMRNLIKFGLEARFHQIDFNDITLRPAGGDELNLATGSPYMTPLVMPLSTPYHSSYQHKPIELSAYIQDKLEYKDMIINVGLRIDHFRPDGVILADPSDPNIYSPLRPENRYNDKNGNGMEDPGETYTLEAREKFWYLPAQNKTQLSPRLGVSFPVTETGVVHFSYGHFFQIPVFELLYRNPQFKLGTGTGNQGIIGNADMRPEQTISGEIGFKQQIGSDQVLDITAYFRDVRSLAGTRSDQIEIFGGSSYYSKLANGDFGFVKGIILTLKNTYRQGINYSVDYTFQTAKGTASDADQARNALAEGNLPEVQLLPLSWDQLHTLNGTVSYLAESWGISMIGGFGSGLPYTPRKTSDVSAFRENSGTKPYSVYADMRVYKEFTFSDYTLLFFLRIFNLFDTLNQSDVYNDTGRADFTTDLDRVRSLNPSLYGINTLEDWYNNASYYTEPRRIELGLTFNF